MAPGDKEEKLFELIRCQRDVIVAFSGGVDSSYLAFIANRVLGKRARAVTALSPSVSERQRELALGFACRHGLNHTLIHTREMEDPNYTGNPVNRCYFCKAELYTHLDRLGEKWGISAILDGSNTDDLGDYRPGRLAAGEKGIQTPLVQVGLNKEEIRSLSRKWGLSSWDLPAMPCLSSRFPYGVKITEEKLRQVDRAESFLRGLGFENFRVRHHDSLARIEMDRVEMARILDLETLSRIEREFRSYGYLYVTLDLRGFRSGSLNQTVELEK
ncbi:MAG: ATP-dependent sacrificial sulfur transferase LarE [Acidobacteriota bacterium]